jgi:hypothetical protein
VQSQNLRTDVNRVLECRAWINTKTKHRYDSNRILGILAAAKGAEHYLPYTIPKIIAQLSEINLGGDIFVGLNNGFECPLLEQQLAILPNVNLIHLYTEAKPASTVPARIFADPYCGGDVFRVQNTMYGSPQHRVFMIHQKQGPHAPGKIRMLSDIYALLLSSIESGWIPTSFLFMFDAESQVLVNQPGCWPDSDSNGLKVIISQLQTQHNLDILGAKNRYVVFRDAKLAEAPILVPDFAAEMPPIQWFLNILHGKYSGYRYLPGGFNVGKSDLMMSIFNVITRNYPGARSEDVQLTVLAEQAGFSTGICLDTISTNRVPAVAEVSNDPLRRPLWIAQVQRWCAAVYALENLYGQQYVQPICSGRFPWNVLLDPVGFLISLYQTEKINLCNLPKQCRDLLIASFVYQTIIRKGLGHPDILTGSEARASW